MKQFKIIVEKHPDGTKTPLILTSLTYPISYRQAHNLNWIGAIQAF